MFPYKETSESIYIVNQLTGFYTMKIFSLNSLLVSMMFLIIFEVKPFHVIVPIYYNGFQDSAAKFSKKLTFLTPWYKHIRVPIRE